MNIDLLTAIQQLNPWLNEPQYPLLQPDHYIPRIQISEILSSDWDSLCTVVIGPRQAGKTTLVFHTCKQLLKTKRFTELLYLSCDILEIRRFLNGPQFIQEVIGEWKLHKPIIFIDEVQRLENPGLLLKTIIDLKLPIKLIASGSSQLEIKSKVQEHLTGRQLEIVVLPLSYQELTAEQTTKYHFEQRLLYGSYPQIVQKYNRAALLLKQLFTDYISKDIVEILRIGKPDQMQKLISLLAHSAGQLVNYNQLATDCGMSVPTVQNYLTILEKTYVICAVRPFVGNKRTEITSNPEYYFIDNGFRNQALNNFIALDRRTDKGLLVENYIFQELYKFNVHNFNPYTIYFWRTEGGAEIDFILYKNTNEIIPIEVKYRTMHEPKISRGFRSFLQAYQPKQAVIITKSLYITTKIIGTTVHFIPLELLNHLFEILSSGVNS